MKKYINKILILFVAAIVSVACEKDYDYTILNPEASIEASTSASSVELIKDEIGTDIFTITWNEPEYGFENESPNYKILFDKIDGDFSEATTVVTTSELSKTFEVDELNKIMLNLGFEPGLATQIQIKVYATIGQYNLVSDVLNVTVTPFANTLDLSTIWGIVGSGAVNGWDGPDMPFYKTSTANELVAYVTLSDGEIKFRSNNSWDVNYGDDGADGSLEAGGANIAVSAGTYKVTFNTESLTYSIEAYTWGLVGDATINSWDGPDMPLTYDSFSDTWKAIVSLGDGEFKIRLNNDWAVNYGDDGVDGTLEPGGANIAVTAGYYLITFDANELTYTLEPIDVWGIVGSAAPNGWDGPNAKFSLDYSKDDVWFLNGVTLTDGEIKFRTNDSWDVNYGDDGVDGTLDLGGANIAVSAGTYNIVLDFSNPNTPIYTITSI